MKKTFREYLHNNTPRQFRTHFRGHEAISVYLAMDPLYRLIDLGVINTIEAESILKIISAHGSLFDSIKDGKEFKPEKVAKKWENDKDIFQMYVAQVRYDSTGRFSPGKDSRKAAKNLGTDIYGQAFMDKYWPEDVLDEGTRILGKNKLTLLVGAPLVGKSHHINKLKEAIEIKIAKEFINARNNK